MLLNRLEFLVQLPANIQEELMRQRLLFVIPEPYLWISCEKRLKLVKHHVLGFWVHLVVVLLLALEVRSREDIMQQFEA